MKVLITGDSQIGALRRAHDLRRANGPPIPDGLEFQITPLASGHQLVRPYSRLSSGRVIMSRPAVSRYIPSFPVTDIEVYGLSAPLHTSRLMRRADWTKFAPLSVRRESQAPVSTELFRQVVIDDQRGNLLFLSMMKRVGLRAFVIEAPRPFRHHPAFASGLNQDVALFVDQQYRQVIRAELTKRGIGIVELPTNVYDDAGFMLDEYALGDAHHGNAEFGELMLRQIIDYVARFDRTAAAA